MKRNKKMCTIAGLTVILSIILAVGCSSNIEVAETKEKPIIAVTVVPEKTFVEAVCGDLVEVVIMVPPGSSPENYEPTPQEMQMFTKASLYFSIGVPTEEANIMPNIGSVKVIALQDEVSSIYADRTFESGERDPHIWLSPKRVKVMVEAISREMGQLDDKNKEIYAQNAEEYIKQLDKLDYQIESALKDVQTKKFVVYHPAFGYLADDYGLQMYAIEEEGKESTIQHLEEMIDLAKEENIKVIFYQKEIDSSQSEAFAEEIGGKTIQLEPLSADYIENLERMGQTMAEVMK